MGGASESSLHCTLTLWMGNWGPETSLPQFELDSAPASLTALTLSAVLLSSLHSGGAAGRTDRDSGLDNTAMAPGPGGQHSSLEQSRSSAVSQGCLPTPAAVGPHKAGSQELAPRRQ